MIVFFTSINRCVPLKRSVSTAPAWSHHWASTGCFTVRQTVFVWRRRVTCLVITFCIAVIVFILYVGVVHSHFCIMRSQNEWNVALFDVVCLCTCIYEYKAWKHSYICCHHSLILVFWFCLVCLISLSSLALYIPLVSALFLSSSLPLSPTSAWE